MLLSFGLLFIIILLSFFTLTDLLGIPFTDINGDYAEYIDDAITGINRAADLKKDNIVRRLSSLLTNVESFANSTLTKSYLSDIVTAQKKTDLQAYLNAFKKTFDIFDFILIADIKNASIIASTRDYEEMQNISGEKYFSGALRSGGTYVCFALDKSDNGLDVYWSHVINKDNIPRYVVVMNIKFSDLIPSSLLRNEERDRSTEFILVESEGLLLTHLKSPLTDGSTAIPLEYKLSTDDALQVSQGQEGFIDTKDYRGVEVLSAYRYIPIDSETGWGLIVKRDYSEVIASFKKKIYYFILSLLQNS